MVIVQFKSEIVIRTFPTRSHSSSVAERAATGKTYLLSPACNATRLLQHRAQPTGARLSAVLPSLFYARAELERSYCREPGPVEDHD
jgi:hypothetical protein